MLVHGNVKQSANRHLLIYTFEISLTNLYRTGVFPESSNDIIIIVLPALVKLLQEPTGDIQEQAPLILADLIKDSQEMQNAAFEADAIARLAELLASVSTAGENDCYTHQLGIPGTGSIAKRKEKIKEVRKIYRGRLTS